MSRTPVPDEFKTAEGITPPQLNFVLSLLDERDLRQSPKVSAATDEDYARAISELKKQAEKLDKKMASRWIEHLLTFPQRPRERYVHRANGNASIPSADDLPSGRYAIENEDGELRFYRLWRGDRNPNYFKLYVEHGPDDSEVPFKSALTILAKIMDAGPWECAQRYGAEIGACSRCGLRLTNRISRMLKIGPVCGGYWHEQDEWKGLVSEARATIRAAGLDPAGNVEDDDNFDYAQVIS